MGHFFSLDLCAAKVFHLQGKDFSQPWMSSLCRLSLWKPGACERPGKTHSTVPPGNVPDDGWKGCGVVQVGREK